jgi:hypothetical protein
MLSKKIKTFILKDLFLALLVSLIFSFFFMELYKKNKNISYFKYDMIINNNLDGMLNNFETKNKNKVLDIVLGRLYDSLAIHVINTDNRSILARTELSEYTRKNIASIPIRELINIKKVKELYLTANFPVIKCKDRYYYKKVFLPNIPPNWETPRPLFSVQYYDLHKDEGIYECRLKRNLLKAFDREKGHIYFYENKLNFTKRENFINENDYFFKLNFFFIFFSIIIIIFRYTQRSIN